MPSDHSTPSATTPVPLTPETSTWRMRWKRRGPGSEATFRCRRLGRSIVAGLPLVSSMSDSQRLLRPLDHEPVLYPQITDDAPIGHSIAVN